METLARAGYGARGCVYVLVGILALLAAIGRGGDTGGSRNALEALMTQPFGFVLVGLLGLGLAAFALWRVVDAVADADRYGTDAKGLAKRFARLVSGAVYAGLAVTAIGLALGRATARGGSDDGQAQGWTAWLFTQPAGRWLVAAIGAVIVGVGISYLWRAATGRVAERLAVPEAHRGWALAAGRLGFGARGIVFAIVGGFLMLAGWQLNAGKALGVGGALEQLRQQPYGATLLAATALGLAAFGVFGLVQARYRRLDAPELADAVPASVRSAADRLTPG